MFVLKCHDIVFSQLLRREQDSARLCEERDELKVKMECQSRECVHLDQTRQGLEADLARSHLEVHLSVSLHVFMCLFMCVGQTYAAESGSKDAYWAKTMFPRA